MMNELDDLIKQRDEINNRINAIKDARDEKQNQPLIGRCFLYQNSDGRDSRWPLYRRVTAIDGAWVTIFQFETTDRDELLINTDRMSSSGSLGTQIRPGEFVSAWNALVDRITEMDP